MSAMIAVLYQAHQAALVRMLTRVIGDADTAEDVCQDVFVAVLSAASICCSSAELVPWLYQKAQQLGLQTVRTRREWCFVPLSACRYVATPPAWLGEPSPEAAILSDLPLDWRAALILQALGFTRAETAVLLGCTVNAVRKYLAAARRFLDVYDIVAPQRGRPPGKHLQRVLPHAGQGEYGSTSMKKRSTGATQ